MDLTSGDTLIQITCGFYLITQEEVLNLDSSGTRSCKPSGKPKYRLYSERMELKSVRVDLQDFTRRDNYFHEGTKLATHISFKGLDPKIPGAITLSLLQQVDSRRKERVEVNGFDKASCLTNLGKAVESRVE
ncbi:hypothetical protein Tco_0651637 [Tanacetum coccineum]|uniref:Uncharacterized protein n=1 Tax=Tanacetum coccineum TaxID=301880 RepID=A0ABQ4WVM4_9ASTR